MKNTISAFKGTYCGMSPTDESAIAMGEAKLVIAGDLMRFSMATGIKVIEETLQVEDFQLMTEDEVKTQFKDGSDAHLETTGFKGKESGYPKLLFSNGTLVIWMGGMGDMLGPTMLAGPGFFPRLKFWVGKWIIDFQTSGGFPRFLYGGRTRRYQ